MNAQQCRARFVDWPSLASHRPLAQLLYGNEGERRIGAWLDAEEARVTDPAFARLFTDYVHGSGLPNHAYNHRVVEGGGHRLLGGIRFFNQDPGRPFVELIAWAPATVDWVAVRRLVADEWHAFRPRWLRVLVPIETRLPRASTTDMTVHAAALGMIADRQAEVLPEVTLEPCTDLDLAIAIVTERYARLAATDPVLGGAMGAAAPEDLAEAQAAERLFAIRPGDAVVGILALAPGAIAWLDGLVVLEEVVDEAHRGRGLAAAAQAAFARWMVRKRSDAADHLLLGTIDDRNAASRKTALKAGRPAVMRYAFMPLTSNDGADRP